MRSGSARAEEGAEGPRVFAVEFTDGGKAEADAAFLWLSRRSPEFAGRWYAGLLTEVGKLSLFPTGRPLAPEDDAFPNVTVRQQLYRRGRLVYRVLFFLVDDDGDGAEDTVRILHVRHGAQRRLNEPQDDEGAAPS